MWLVQTLESIWDQGVQYAHLLGAWYQKTTKLDEVIL